MTLTDYDRGPCPGDCGMSNYGITVGCVECARRHPDRFANLSADQAEELDELRQVLIAAENWFLSVAETRTAEESALALALRTRSPRLGVNRGIRITDFPAT